ncbi:MAG: hypothetical protein WC346_16245 [Methanogenium sp.]|jgi:hypothetical protein
MDATYQVAIYKDDGGNRQNFTSDASVKAVDEEFTGTELRNILRATKSLVITSSDGSVALSTLGGSAPCVFPSEYGLIIISCTNSMLACSARLYSAVAGDKVKIVLRTPAGLSTTAVTIFLSGHASGIAGAGVLGTLSGGLSSIILNASVASMGFVELLATANGTWAVIGKSSITEQGAS